MIIGSQGDASELYQERENTGFAPNASKVSHVVEDYLDLGFTYHIVALNHRETHVVYSEGLGIFVLIKGDSLGYNAWAVEVFS